MSIPAVTVEIGNPQVFQEDLIERVLVGVFAVLAARNMYLVPRLVQDKPAMPVVCKHSAWIYTNGGGTIKETR